MKTLAHRSRMRTAILWGRGLLLSGALGFAPAWAGDECKVVQDLYARPVEGFVSLRGEPVYEHLWRATPWSEPWPADCEVGETVLEPANRLHCLASAAGPEQARQRYRKLRSQLRSCLAGLPGKPVAQREEGALPEEAGAQADAAGAVRGERTDWKVPAPGQLFEVELIHGAREGGPAFYSLTIQAMRR